MDGKGKFKHSNGSILEGDFKRNNFEKVRVIDI